MIDKMPGAKWGYINEKQEPEPIPQKYQELIEIREKAVAESMLKIIDTYQKELGYMTSERNMYASILANLQEWVEAEIEEVEVLIDPCAEEYERLCGVLDTFQKVLDKIKEL